MVQSFACYGRPHRALDPPVGTVHKLSLPPVRSYFTPCLVSVLARDRVESAYLTYECVRVWVVSKDTGVWTMDTEYVLGSARCYTSETYK